MRQEDFKTFDVITIGSSTIDAFCKTDAKIITQQDSKGKEELIAYPVGTKILVNDLQFMVGGGGTNTAVAFSRLGLKTAYLGALGNDENSNTVLDLLKKENISFIGKIKEKQMTGYSVILDSIEEDRTILTYKGANDSYSLSDIDKTKFSASWLYMCAMTGNSLKELGKTATLAKKKGMKVAFNPSSYIAKNGIKKLPMMKYVDILIINKEEMNELLAEETSSPTDIIKLKRISAYGPKTVVVTDGSDEVFAYHEKKLYSLKPSKVKVAETTGAGDAFASTFISGMILGKSIQDSLIMGMINSQSVIAHYGAKNILLSKEELLKRLKKIKIKVSVLS